jgi:SAM-dependent methyltransferase
MSGARSVRQPAGDFEFSALETAAHYRAALAREFHPYLRGRVLEVGAGVGQFTELLLAEPAIDHLQAIDPEARFAERLRRRFPGLAVVAGTIAALPAAEAFDAVVSVNVLEHIADDGRELAAYFQRLAPKHGTLCLFVPAGPEIFGSIDLDFGHCRRYRRRELRGKLESAGFRVQRLAYFNLLGYFAWWWNFRVRRRHAFSPAAVRLFDRFLFPLQHALESRLLRPPLGQSLIAVAVAG